MTRLQRLTGLIVCGYLSWAGSARADAVTDWNAIAVQTINAAVPPRLSASPFLDIAMVQAAVYDAVEAIDRRFKPYHVKIPGASGSPDAARKSKLWARSERWLVAATARIDPRDTSCPIWRSGRIRR